MDTYLQYYFVHIHVNNALHKNTYSLIGKPGLAIIASNVGWIEKFHCRVCEIERHSLSDFRGSTDLSTDKVICNSNVKLWYVFIIFLKIPLWFRLVKICNLISFGHFNFVFNTMNFFETFWKPYFCKIVNIEFFNFRSNQSAAGIEFQVKIHSWGRLFTVMLLHTAVKNQIPVWQITVGRLANSSTQNSCALYNNKQYSFILK